MHVLTVWSKVTCRRTAAWCRQLPNRANNYQLRQRPFISAQLPARKLRDFLYWDSELNRAERVARRCWFTNKSCNPADRRL